MRLAQGLKSTCPMRQVIKQLMFKPNENGDVWNRAAVVLLIQEFFHLLFGHGVGLGQEVGRGRPLVLSSCSTTCHHR